MFRLSIFLSCFLFLPILMADELLSPFGELWELESYGKDPEYELHRIFGVSHRPTIYFSKSKIHDFCKPADKCKYYLTGNDGSNQFVGSVSKFDHKTKEIKIHILNSVSLPGLSPSHISKFKNFYMNILIGAERFELDNDELTLKVANGDYLKFKVLKDNKA